MPLYCQIEDLAARCGDHLLKRCTRLEEDGAEAAAEKMNAAIRYATDFLDAQLAAVPEENKGTVTPAVLNQHCVTLALYRLALAAAIVNGDIRDDWARTMAWLERLKERPLAQNRAAAEAEEPDDGPDDNEVQLARKPPSGKGGGDDVMPPRSGRKAKDKDPPAEEGGEPPDDETEEGDEPPDDETEDA